jgi:hypothetical protein
MRRLQILGAWAAGCAVGAATMTVILSGGCVGSASADDTTVVECSAQLTTVEYTLPDNTPETFARLSVVRSGETCVGTTAFTSQQVSAVNGKISIPCPDTDCTGQKAHPKVTYTFVIR